MNAIFLVFLYIVVYYNNNTDCYFFVFDFFHFYVELLSFSRLFVCPFLSFAPFVRSHSTLSCPRFESTCFHRAVKGSGFCVCISICLSVALIMYQETQMISLDQNHQY